MKVLLSLKPTYAEQILAGTKKYEFRRRIFRNSDAVSVVMYATKPVGKVVGEFKIKKIHEGHPDELWTLTSRHAGISHEKYLEYFAGRGEGYAIEISEVDAYEESFDIGDILASGKPPQSFAYLPYPMGDKERETTNITRRKALLKRLFGAKTVADPAC